MKFLVVVLALSGLCAAQPEADPALVTVNASPYNLGLASPLVNNLGLVSPYAGLTSPLAYNNLALNNLAYSNLGYSNLAYNNLRYSNLAYNNLAYSGLLPAATPLVRAGPVAARTVATPLGLAVQSRALTSNDCVTIGGCAARAISEGARLVKRESDPESDAQLISAISPASALTYGVNPYLGYAGLPTTYNSANLLNAYGLNAYGLNTYANNYLNAYNLAAPQLAINAPVAVQTPLIKSVAIDAPIAVQAPLVKTVAVQTPTVVRNVAYRKPVAVPVVETRAVPVEYTHAGAHPLVNSVKTLETRQRVVGHQLI